MILLYCCDLLEAKDMSAAWHGTTRQQSCVRCHSAYKKMVVGKGVSSHVAAETMEKGSKLRELEEETGKLVGRGPSTNLRQILDGTGSPLSGQSRTEWPLFLENMSGGDERGGELYSQCPSEPL